MDVPILPSLLIADDDPIFANVLARALRRRGYTVGVAHGVEEAWRLAESDPPEYAVVDLRMPDDSGLELVRRLRALDGETRIVVLTGYASVATAVEAIKLGATHYLAKPADAEQILAAFQRLEGNPNIELAEQPWPVERLEWEHIQRVLQEHEGNISATARALRMHRRTLQRKLAKRPVRE